MRQRRMPRLEAATAMISLVFAAAACSSWAAAPDEY